MTRPVVVHVLEAISAGCARHLVDLVSSAEEVDHVVVCPTRRVGDVTDEQALQWFRDAGVPLHPVEMRRSATSWRNAVAVVRVARIARRAGADVVHGHSSIGGVVARSAGLVVRTPRVYTPNGLAPGRVATIVERFFGRFTDRFVAVSPSERDEAVARHFVDPDRVLVIPNAIAPAAPAPRSLRERLGIGATTPLVGFVGRLVPQKAPEVFVAAAGIVAGERPDAVFVLVGDGPLAEEVRDAAAATTARIELLSHLPEAASYFADLDVLAQPSRYEGGPYVPLEGLRAGVAVVLSDVTGNRDVIEPGRSGELVPPDDPPALAGAILGLLAEPDRRRALAAAGTERFRERFSLAAMGRSHDELYAALAARSDRKDR